MAIDSWSSEGMDWSSMDALRFKPLYPYCEALRLALKERYIAASMSLSEFLTENSCLFRSEYYFVSNFQNLSWNSDLITKYVNITDGMSWHGVEENAFATPWTKYALLATLDTPEKITLSDFGVLTAEWVFQQYQTLNSLRVLKKPNSFNPEKPHTLADNPETLLRYVYYPAQESEPEHWQWEGIYGATWEAFLVRFNEAVWVTPDISGILAGHVYYIGNYGDGFNSQFRNVKWYFPYYLINCAFDIYLYTPKPDFPWEYYTQSFHPLANCTLENRWNLAKSFDIDNHSLAEGYIFSREDFIPVENPQYGLSAFVPTSQYFIIKPDFKFKNW